MHAKQHPHSSTASSTFAKQCHFGLKRRLSDQWEQHFSLTPKKPSSSSSWRRREWSKPTVQESSPIIPSGDGVSSKWWCQSRSARQCCACISLYLALYGFVVGIFAAGMAVLLNRVVLDDQPYLTGTDSVLSLQPGLSIVPQPDYLTTLIRFKDGKKYTFRKYTDDMVAFLQKYEVAHIPYSDALVNCPDSTVKDLGSNSRYSCRFDVDKGGICNWNKEFGYDEGQPCIIVKMNQVYGWLPDLEEGTEGPRIKCQGRSEVDRDLVEELCYYDDNYVYDPDINAPCKNTDYGELKHWYFPYIKQVNYQSPLVFVSFNKFRKHVLIRMECSLLVKNVKNSTVYFEILVD